MKRLVILAFPLLLVACQDGKITPAETVLTGCNGYIAALNTATNLNKAGQLSTKAVATVDSANKIASPLCLGPSPKFDGSAIDTVSVESATNMIQAAIKEF